jgi:hypothetical protein
MVALKGGDPTNDCQCHNICIVHARVFIFGTIWLKRKITRKICRASKELSECIIFVQVHSIVNSGILQKDWDTKPRLAGQQVALPKFFLVIFRF